VNALPVLDLHERDIGSSLCQRCGACCRVFVAINNADSRFRRFLRTTGASVIPPAVSGQQDCCDEDHDIQVDLGWCQHLEILDEADVGRRFRCKVYGTPEFPDLCAHYNCVSWAKFANAYDASNEILIQAQEAFNRLRAEDANPNGAPDMAYENDDATSASEVSLRPGRAKHDSWWGSVWQAKRSR
jgi:hypothetical protein